MFTSLIAYLQHTVIPLGPLGVFGAGFIEEVVAPIPSSLVLLMSGFFFLSGEWSLALVSDLFIRVVLPGSLGITLGSLFVYGFVYFFGKAFIDRWGKYIGLSWESVLKVQEKLARGAGDEVTLFVLRIIPVVPSVAINALSGLIQMPLLRYITITFFGTVIRATVLGIIGWRAGAFYTYYAEVIGVIENALFIASAIAVVMFFIINKSVKLTTRKI